MGCPCSDSHHWTVAVCTDSAFSCDRCDETALYSCVTAWWKVGVGCNSNPMFMVPVVTIVYDRFGNSCETLNSADSSSVSMLNGSTDYWLSLFEPSYVFACEGDISCDGECVYTSEVTDSV